MSGLDPDALDRWITGGRHSSQRLWVRCPGCDEETAVLAETEYGTTEWSPPACSQCGRDFTGDEPYRDDEPDIPDEAWTEIEEDD